MKVSDLVETDDWDNKDDSLESLDKKLDSIYHREEFYLNHLSRKGLITQKFPINDIADVIPTEVFNHFDDYVSFELNTIDERGDDQGRTRIYVKKSDTQLVHQVHKAATQLNALVRQRYKVHQRIKQLKRK